MNENNNQTEQGKAIGEYFSLLEGKKFWGEIEITMKNGEFKSLKEVRTKIRLPNMPAKEKVAENTL